uniref:Seed biotin-containing protein SBP65-like n=1 Tax=Nicotiana tabacum TaxID=4097 RepID=A0A1S4C3N6_TOBAC|nr:PREDICTED: uncharacterized protein LOC107814795 [Nicotiana tabacum]
MPLYCNCCKHQGHDEKTCRYISKKTHNPAAIDELEVFQEQTTGEKYTGDLRQLLNEKRGVNEGDRFAGEQNSLAKKKMGENQTGIHEHGESSVKISHICGVPSTTVVHVEAANTLVNNAVLNATWDRAAVVEAVEKSNVQKLSDASKFDINPGLQGGVELNKVSAVITSKDEKRPVHVGSQLEGKHATIAVVEHHKNAGQEPATVGSKLEATVNRHPVGIANHNAAIGDTRLKDIPASTDFTRMYSATAGALKAAADRADTSNKPDMVQQQFGASGTAVDVHKEQQELECVGVEQAKHSPKGVRQQPAAHTLADDQQKTAEKISDKTATAQNSGNENIGTKSVLRENQNGKVIGDVKKADMNKKEGDWSLVTNRKTPTKK